MRVPRLLISAPASGQGKTTVAVGLMAALTRAGASVAPAKVGPDYIDPGYHALATGRAGRNLDPWLQGEDRIVPLLLHGAAAPPAPADLTVIEGVMGLFDGKLGSQGWGSSAHVAALTATPVVLVVDISAASRTVAALVQGMAGFDQRVRIAGVVLNKAGSDRQVAEVTGAVESLGMPVLGVLPRDAGVYLPSRHLGLVPAAERGGQAGAALDRLADEAARHLDLSVIRELAESAPPMDGAPWSPGHSRREGPRSARVAVAGGRAFSFRYAETDEILAALGCEPVLFDPATDTELPAGVSGLYLGGGFPEQHATALAGNRRLLEQIRDAVLSGMPTVAECAGLLYLSHALDAQPMAGVIPAEARMTAKLTLGYRTATAPADTLLAAAGDQLRGHEFHRTATEPAHGATPAWALGDPAEPGRADGWSLNPGAVGHPSLHASYLHLHWAGCPATARRFADAVHAFADRARGMPQPEVSIDTRHARSQHTTRPVTTHGAPGHNTRHARSRQERRPVTLGGPLEHHGDAETDPSLVDFAVNVRLTQPPSWLSAQLRDAVGQLAAYPDVEGAQRAVARRHGIPSPMVLPTNGAAEAFVLLARATTARHPVVVHPQFTEPEAALRRAGLPVHHHLLNGNLTLNGDFTLDPDSVPDHADLVIIGNPTNPTGVLHPREALETLRRPGRLLVVDEAFMDAVPATEHATEPESMIGPDMTGVLVLRSLTKMWALAGLRAGYAAGDPEVIAQLASQQPHWSVNTLAAMVMEATATPAALAEAGRAADELALWRAHLVAGLRRLGLEPVPSTAPFVLVNAGLGVREALRGRGYAVRRGDTFPGLDAGWVRIAVRDPLITDGLLRELGEVLESRDIRPTATASEQRP